MEIIGRSWFLSNLRFFRFKVSHHHGDVVTFHRFAIRDFSGGFREFLSTGSRSFVFVAASNLHSKFAHRSLGQIRRRR